MGVWARYKERYKIIKRILSKEYFIVFTWDGIDEVAVNGHYRAYHKANQLLNDVIEAYWKSKYEEANDN